MDKTLPRAPLFACILLIFPFVFSSASSAILQEKDLVTRLSNRDQISRTEIKELDGDEIQTFLHRFDSAIAGDEDRFVRLNGYRFLNLLSRDHPQYGPEIIDILVLSGLSDNDPGNRKSVCGFLEDFPKDMFSVRARNRISRHAIAKDSPFKKIVRLSAKLELKDLAAHFNHLLITGSVNPATRWTIRVALGRLGDKESAQWCIDQVRQIGMNDQVVHHLAPDLVFMNYKPAIDYLLETISGEGKNCSSPNPDSDVKINCAYRLMEVVAPAIKGFPVQTDEGGNLLTDDYTKALKTVREWIVEHSDGYELREI